jgi:hypothetical protein
MVGWSAREVAGNVEADDGIGQKRLKNILEW